MVLSYFKLDLSAIVSSLRSVVYFYVLAVVGDLGACSRGLREVRSHGPCHGEFAEHRAEIQSGCRLVLDVEFYFFVGNVVQGHGGDGVNQ